MKSKNEDMESQVSIAMSMFFLISALAIWVVRTKIETGL